MVNTTLMLNICQVFLSIFPLAIRRKKLHSPPNIRRKNTHLPLDIRRKNTHN